MTVNEGLALVKTLKERHAELKQLRGQNATRHVYRDATTPTEEPTYSIVVIDSMLVAISKELRHLDGAIKKSNAKTELKDFIHDEDVLRAVAAS